MATDGFNPYSTPVSDIQDSGVRGAANVKIFSFRGRLGRVRYLAYLMGLLLVVWLGGSVLAVGLAAALPASGEGPMTTLLMLAMAGVYGTLLLGAFVLAIRRVHDFNGSGWWTLLLLVPLVNIVFGFALWFIPGTKGANRFGAETPKNGLGVSILAALAPLSAVAYIGVMAAIAIPAYQDYVKRAQEQAQTQQR